MVEDWAAVPEPVPPGVVAPDPSPRLVAVVPHTHWDREWYLPFQGFRLRLVELLDAFLPAMEADPSYAHFLLDGQMAVIDDYLALRPDAEDTLRRLAAAGRLAVGPWYILMDEFGVSGETIIRNLQYGLARAAAFGGEMLVGYLPDMFGHVAQMPQLLHLAGFEHAVVWRGVPAAVDKTAFWWSAPDGSTVRAEYLRGGYGNGAALPDDAKALLRRVAAHEVGLGDFIVDPGAPILWMNGTDHQTPQPWLGRVLAEANAVQDRYRLVVTSLAEYLASAPRQGLAHWRGEMRSGARANLLMGVASNRVDVKIAAARAERALERRAEPLCALWLPPDQWPQPELAAAWREVITNSAHDSICACSADEVGAAVLHRFSEATTIADGLVGRALRVAGASMASAGAVVINPTARPRSGVVEVELAGDEAVIGAQVVETVAAGAMAVAGTGADLEALLGRLAEAGFRSDADYRSVDLAADDAGVVVNVVQARGRPVGADVGAAMAEVEAQAGAHRDRPLQIRVQRQAWQRVAVYADDVPGFGWKAWTPGPLPVAPVVADGLCMANGLVAVTVDPLDGTWSIAGPAAAAVVAGLDRLVDGGDGGDTYNYSPPAGDVVIDRPESVSVAVAEAGPVRARLRITRLFDWPQRLVDDARVGCQRIEVVTDVELRAGEDVVRVTAGFDNRCRDHRLRAVFPLPSVATSSRAECAFALVERGLEAEGGPHEYPLPTFPSRRFVSAGGLTVWHEGLLEYEVIDGGRALALTLLRATGILARPTMAYRPNAAGPALALEGPQMQGRVSVRYAVGCGHRDPYQVADETWVPLEVTTGTGTGTRPTHGSRLKVTGAEVSAVQVAGGSVEVRVFNPSTSETTVVIDGRSGFLVDLRGTPIGAFDRSFGLRPGGIATARLNDAGAAR